MKKLLPYLDFAHKKLDEAVFAAYGWKSDLMDGHPSGVLCKDFGEAAGVWLPPLRFAPFGDASRGVLR